MEDVRILTTMEEVKAISDPMKYRILACLSKLGEPATVKQIADSMNEVPAKVHYHVKKMESCGILVMVDTKEIKGIIAKYYEPTAKSFELKCDNAAIKSNKQLVQAGQQRLISEMYENSKNSLLEQTAELFKNSDDMNVDADGEGKDDGKGNEVSGSQVGMFFLEEVYLDNEDTDEFRDYVKAFMESHNDGKKKNQTAKRYHFFMSLFQLEK